MFNLHLTNDFFQAGRQGFGLNGLEAFFCFGAPKVVSQAGTGVAERPMSPNRVSRTAKKILLLCLRNGAMTVKELVLSIDNEKAIDTPDLLRRIRATRMNSCFRTLKYLKRNGLLTMKYRLEYCQYVPYCKGRFFYGFERDGAWYGWYLKKRSRDFSCIYGLTSKGRQVASEYRQELKKLAEEWQPFL